MNLYQLAEQIREFQFGSADSNAEIRILTDDGDVYEINEFEWDSEKGEYVITVFLYEEEEDEEDEEAEGLENDDPEVDDQPLTDKLPESGGSEIHDVNVYDTPNQ
jgi:hypothetical protein